MSILHVSDTPNTLFEQLTEFVFTLSQASIEKNGYFSIALSGGSTPNQWYEYMVSRPELDFSAWRFYSGDERLLTPDSQDSNFAMANKYLYQPLIDSGRIAVEQIHKINLDITWQQAMASYLLQLPPSFDLIILGLGNDGHAASLIPGKPSLQSQDRLTHTTPGEVPPFCERITITIPEIKSAKAVAFLVSGASKSDIVSKIISGDTTTPAGMINTIRQCDWFLDSPATSKL